MAYTFSRQVSPQEMVQEIHQVLMDREDTCHRTCFSLHLDGNMLDHFSELRSIEGLQEGSVLRVVEGWLGRGLSVRGGLGSMPLRTTGNIGTDEWVELGLEHRSTAQDSIPCTLRAWPVLI